jgi:uncharacterized protein YdaU (DUF1376 family)
MAKDPAFLFYTSDFLSGISDLTMEERGQYITLLCLQHQKGRLSEKTIRLSVGSVSVDVIAKFQKDDAGNFFNKRLDEESLKRDKFLNSRILNGSKGGRPKANGYPNAKPKNNLPEDINENRNEIENWDSVRTNFLNAYEWKEDFCRKKGITMTGLEIMIKQFVADVELREEYKPLKELKSHFTNTYNKKINGTHQQAFRKGGGKSEGAEQLLSSLKTDIDAAGAGDYQD